jgi:sugar/nucleoside kinase (ribokinase family)
VADLLVVGSVALDTVETPFGKVQDALGGAATYFACAASFFTRVRLVGTVGTDFPDPYMRLLRERGVDTGGLVVAPGRTFRWAARYGYDLNERTTLDTQLNVFADFRPQLGPELRRAPFLFLANIDPELQLDVLRQMAERPRLVALDTMNFWIEGKGEALRRVLAEVDVAILNDAEARQLTQEPSLVKATRGITAMGPKTVAVKLGEYGALMLTDGAFFIVPAYPLESVCDPTGAGDAFAGGFMGYLAAQARTDGAALRRALVYGSVMASFTVEDFSLKRLLRLRPDEIDERYTGFQALMRLEA